MHSFLRDPFPYSSVNVFFSPNQIFKTERTIFGFFSQRNDFPFNFKTFHILRHMINKASGLNHFDSTHWYFCIFDYCILRIQYVNCRRKSAFEKKFLENTTDSVTVLVQFKCDIVSGFFLKNKTCNDARIFSTSSLKLSQCTYHISATFW